MNRWILPVFLGLACGEGKEPAEGTAVGNPGTLSMDVALSSGFSVVSAVVPIKAVKVINVDAEEIVLLDQGDLDFSGDTLEVPPGEYTDLIFEFSDNLEITGQRERDSGTGFVLPLHLRAIELSTMGGATVLVDGDEHGMMLGVENFLAPVEPALLDGEQTLVSDPEIRAQVEDAVRNESSAGRIGDDGSPARTLRGL